MVQTGPTPIFGPLDQTGSQRISLNVSQDREQVIILRDWKSFESTLPHVTA
jgi:hypothetical protein